LNSADRAVDDKNIADNNTVQSIARMTSLQLCGDLRVSLVPGQSSVVFSKSISRYRYVNVS
jgi:hypothetical protein